jgi:hypothetical protein
MVQVAVITENDNDVSQHYRQQYKIQCQKFHEKIWYTALNVIPVEVGISSGPNIALVTSKRKGYLPIPKLE